MDGGREVGRSHWEEVEREGRGGPLKRERVRWFLHPQHHRPPPPSSTFGDGGMEESVKASPPHTHSSSTADSQVLKLQSICDLS